MYYFLIIISALLFSGQFVFNKKIQEKRGSSYDTSLFFSIYNGFGMFLIMLALSGFKLKFTLFSICAALIYGLNSVTLSYCTIKSFKTANVGVYSMFSMLGGMLLPFIYGIIFLQEGITPFKVISCALILLSLLITSWTKVFSFAAFKYYIGVFVLNGLVGVIATVHQSGVGESISSQNFMALTSLSTCLIASMIYLVKNRKLPGAKKDELLCLGGHAIFCGVGNLFVLIALTHLPASVQYPFVTGGVIVFSTVIAFFQKEKLTKKTCVAVLIALLATVFVIL